MKNLKLQQSHFYETIIDDLEIDLDVTKNCFLKYCFEENDEYNHPSAAALFINSNTSATNWVNVHTVGYRLKKSLSDCYDLIEIASDFATANTILEIFFNFVKLAMFTLKPVNIAKYNENITIILLSAYSLGACRVPVDCNRLIENIQTFYDKEISNQDIERILTQLDEMNIIDLEEYKIKIREYIFITYKEDNND